MNVSRETTELEAAYLDLVRRWSPRINLVSRTDLPRLEERHLRDSRAVVDVAPVSADCWVDLGSGGGFPGIVAAIHRRSEGTSVHLVESDVRKAMFLRTVARELDLNVVVHSDRIEQAEVPVPDVLSARALAPLPKLLSLAHLHCGPRTVMVFPKGVTWRAERDAALPSWRFSLQTHPSPTQPDAAILVLTDVEPLSS
ncbi:class I SAM-dependent methyltransferase [Jannaschia sp. Os4]|uniref:16S rRNA (guanine(527)-N(7))-methyltransferase RsmG n=1 Tax=Jannaschia sp. Os4 TaxID=2807617 RepID=UPI001939EEAC|nr:16S rRNA (guanine(527)-N(7))-methyltransferase RsmG [Jannaschia sp. Os4]MBM2575551.1 class I SAM-dependent methyltransferase [Jannaschia sp. Os4]